jgi:hypothetical protein
MENLDTMSIEGLHAWAVKYTRNTCVKPRLLARELFPEQPKGYVSAMYDTGNYAWNKYTAMQCRLRGEIDPALMYEAIADRIYEKLPEFARW